LRFETIAFEAKLAGMGEDGWAVALDMLVEPDAGSDLGHIDARRGLADLKRIAPQVVAIQIDEVEGVSALVPCNRNSTCALTDVSNGVTQN